MDRAVSVNYWLGLVAFLLLQGVVSVEGRSIFNPGNHVYHPREGTDGQNKILALLLHRSLEPVERNYALGLHLDNKLAELVELEALKEGLELSSNILAEDKSIPRKRDCFWKYCV
ncbi:urotensin-2B-like [Coregonus clupeaformis]|uniref:urotensin-2B-like n=1 Tax=Coregonus clupeaformis TaxID=59861 RepID=UPI001BE0ACD6|nr:urotensin-2B-like [Coregonus clupeaformis]